jgi:hypothetical protein
MKRLILSFAFFMAAVFFTWFTVHAQEIHPHKVRAGTMTCSAEISPAPAAFLVRN